MAKYTDTSTAQYFKADTKAKDIRIDWNKETCCFWGCLLIESFCCACEVSVVRLIFVSVCVMQTASQKSEVVLMASATRQHTTEKQASRENKKLTKKWFYRILQLHLCFDLILSFIHHRKLVFLILIWFKNIFGECMGHLGGDTETWTFKGKMILLFKSERNFIFYKMTAFIRATNWKNRIIRCSTFQRFFLSIIGYTCDYLSYVYDYVNSKFFKLNFHLCFC